MSESGETTVTNSVARPGSRQLVSATVWAEGRGPAKCDPEADLPTGGICWFDVELSADSSSVLELLAPFCDGLEREMIDDLLCPDDLPENRRWRSGAVRLASSFGVYPPDARFGSDWSRKAPPSPRAVYQAVELLAGEGWLVTKWHKARLYHGVDCLDDAMEPVGKAELLDAVARRWLEIGQGNAGDLGVLVMRELALTYAPAQRHFHAALEEWELGLYGIKPVLQGRDPEAALKVLWGARARLRDWLSPLNVPGLSDDPDKAWLPADSHEGVKAVDERVNKALSALSNLGDTLRSSFHLLHIQQSEAQREQRERLQRRVELIAAVFLVPTFIVGFFGSNTWVPGEHRPWGLTLMVVTIVALTCIVIGVLWATYNRRGARRTVRLPHA